MGSLTTRDVLLRRLGLVFIEPHGGHSTDDQLRAAELELAAVGHLPTNRLRQRLARLGPSELTAFVTWASASLAVEVGGGRGHVPLFRSFPHDIPADTYQLWLAKVVVHFLQAPGQRCLTCGATGTTHVLTPCHHVVCDQCWDGASYSACPVCEHRIDPASPFLQPAPARGQPVERITFKLLDLGDDLDAATRTLINGFCARTQAMSPDDRAALTAIVREHGVRVLTWLPERIPVKENIAIIFGTLFKQVPADVVLPVARRHLATATDVLRLIAVYSDADPSLAARPVKREVVQTSLIAEQGSARWWGRLKRALLAAPRYQRTTTMQLQIRRFQVARLSRPLRRALLAILDGIPAEQLTEDMLRHRSFWVSIGEFLHPSEHTRRFPTAAAAFDVVRRRLPGDRRAPTFRGFHGKLEAAFRSRDVATMTALLRQRPGELARRFDHALRIAGANPAAMAQVTDAFVASVPACGTPVLLTLRSLLPTRLAPAATRLFWPKGSVGRAVARADDRPLLTADAIAPALRAIDDELLARFAALPGFADAVVDVALADVVVPFNERTASRAAVSLPRGTRIPVADGKTVRLFLHWCQPQGGATTDLDLSVAFYDEAWQYRGVCSYYELTCTDRSGQVLATSGGDLQDAPFPDGASELVDVDRAAACADGVRYAVMVVTAFAGLKFAGLERAFAGIMLRDDRDGDYFDPRTVELRFDLQGEHGVFLPLVLDLAAGSLHWLDVHARGAFEHNNVARSRRAIATICPEMIGYFATGLRASMYELGLLHAAARCRRVSLRDPAGAVETFVRRPDEPEAAFLARLRAGTGGDRAAAVPGLDAPAFAALLHGDLDLPAGSACYALFRDRVTAPLAAADLLASAPLA